MMMPAAQRSRLVVAWRAPLRTYSKLLRFQDKPALASTDETLIREEAQLVRVVVLFRHGARTALSERYGVAATPPSAQRQGAAGASTGASGSSGPSGPKQASTGSSSSGAGSGGGGGGGVSEFDTVSSEGGAGQGSTKWGAAGACDYTVRAPALRYRSEPGAPPLQPDDVAALEAAVLAEGPTGAGAGPGGGVAPRGGCGRGQLTRLGYTQGVSLGLWLRSRYGLSTRGLDPERAGGAPGGRMPRWAVGAGPLDPAFRGPGAAGSGPGPAAAGPGPGLVPPALSARSTHVARALLTLQGVLEGLDGPSAGEQAPGRAPRTVPVLVAPQSHQLLYANTDKCPRLAVLARLADRAAQVLSDAASVDDEARVRSALGLRPLCPEQPSSWLSWKRLLDAAMCEEAAAAEPALEADAAALAGAAGVGKVGAAAGKAAAAGAGAAGAGKAVTAGAVKAAVLKPGKGAAWESALAAAEEAAEDAAAVAEAHAEEDGAEEEEQASPPPPPRKAKAAAGAKRKKQRPLRRLAASTSGAGAAAAAVDPTGALLPLPQRPMPLPDPGTSPDDSGAGAGEGLWELTLQDAGPGLLQSASGTTTGPGGRQLLSMGEGAGPGPRRAASGLPGNASAAGGRAGAGPGAPPDAPVLLAGGLTPELYAVVDEQATRRVAAVLGPPCNGTGTCQQLLQLGIGLLLRSLLDALYAAAEVAEDAAQAALAAAAEGAGGAGAAGATLRHLAAASKPRRPPGAASATPSPPGPPAVLELVSGHDSTLMPIMAALGHPLTRWPPFISNLVLELYRVPLRRGGGGSGAGSAAAGSGSGGADGGGSAAGDDGFEDGTEAGGADGEGSDPFAWLPGADDADAAGVSVGGAARRAVSAVRRMLGLGPSDGGAEAEARRRLQLGAEDARAGSKTRAQAQAQTRRARAQQHLAEYRIRLLYNLEPLEVDTPTEGRTWLPRLDSLEALLRPYTTSRPAYTAACRHVEDVAGGGGATWLEAQVGKLGAAAAHGHFFDRDQEAAAAEQKRLQAERLEALRRRQRQGQAERQAHGKAQGQG
ncbi:hypothetical protein HYH03_002403 [Edaphochlamys debaryana]|uniref:Uncharacterized protein n=1 Tax=Edaphochlamys debaryana TaxID=47281 RepID=A0A835YB95_9CHLO|nr:hypothetical protein HYH03_002403 [Edaphochlamys debaryana]|eukprot:KAG2499456.1 hypothetical protein HYH03_002403 [Edaphochlamys debaryana]